MASFLFYVLFYNLIDRVRYFVVKYSIRHLGNSALLKLHMFILRESIWYFFFFQMCLAPILVIFAIHITCNFTPPPKKMFVGLINILCIIFFFLHLVQCNKLVPEIKLIKSGFFKFTFDISRRWEWILRNLLLYWKLKIKLQWPQSWDNSYLYRYLNSQGSTFYKAY